MDTIVSNPDKFSQDYSTDSASLDKFDQDYADKLVYEDVVVKSGVNPDICRLNFPTAIGEDFYDGLYRDTDKSTNSGGSIEAARNLARCTGDAGYFLGNKFHVLSDLAGDTKAARYGIIKSKGTYRPAGMPAIGFRTINGRYRQLAGAPIALNFKKESKGFGKATTTKAEPRRYHQPIGKPLEIFFPRVTVAIGELVMAKAGLPMPEFPVIGLDGEWLGFWDLVRESGCPIVITEGEKKAAALISRGYAAIGLPGINTGYRVTERGETITNPDGTEYQRAIARELHEALRPFDTADREVTILFDYRAGDYSQSKEFKAACTTAKLFKSAIAKIAQLPGPDKGVDDFVVAGGDIDSVLAAAPTFDAIEKQILKWLSKKNREKAWALTYPIAWECNQRYLDIPYHSGLIGVKSPKNTGKTYDLIKLIAQAHAEGRKVLLLTHRVALGRAICKAVGIPWIEEMHGDADRKTEGKAMGFGLCVDSLHPLSQARFNPLVWEGALVIVDEAEQVFWHVLNSSTCRENRQAILTSLKVLLQTVLSTGGTVRLQDADLSDISIDFVREFTESDVKPWIAVNHWQPSEPWDITFYDTYYVKGEKQDNPSGLLKVAVEEVENGGKIWVSVDSQKVKSKFGAKNLEKYFKSRCPGKKIIRIDSETVANPEHPAYQCAETVSELAALYDIVICSPSLATGVSVDLRGHFTAVFGIFQGAISDNEVRQSLARVREAIPRHIWCRQIALGKIGNGESNYKAVAKSKDKDCRYNLQLLKDFEFDLDKAYNPVVLKFWAKYAARINSSIWDFRESVFEGLEGEGHDLLCTSQDDRKTTGEINELKIINQVEEAVLVTEAPDIDKDEREKLENKRSKTDLERYSEEKYDIKKIYKVEEVSPELRQLHQEGYYNTIYLHYLLTHNPDFLWMRDRKHIEGQIARGDGQICQQDIRMLTGKLKIHETLDTLQFTVPGKEWNLDSPEVIEFANKALKIDADIKDLCGITISRKKVAENPIGIIQSFLRQIGAKLSGSQRREEDKRKRWYNFAGFSFAAKIYDRKEQKTFEPEGLRSQIFEAWQKRDELALFEFQQQQQGISAVELDVTLDLKPSPSKVRVKKDLYLGSVTASPIDIENIPSVTTASTVETSPEPRVEPQPEPTGRMGWGSVASAVSQGAIDAEPEAESPIALWTGWVNRWGKLHKARFKSWCEYGTRYVVEYLEASGNLGETQVDPKNFVWAEGGASC